MVEEINGWIKNLDEAPTGSGKAVEMQQSMIQHAYEFILETGGATREEIVNSLPDYTAHYTNFEGLWIYCIREALDTCDDLESPNSGNKAWQYIGDKELPPELDIEIGEWVERVDVPGEKMTKKERRALLQYSYNFLQETGEAQRGGFKKFIREHIPERTGSYNTFDSLWTYLLSEGLKSAPGVQAHRTSDGSPIIYSYSE